MKFLDRRKFILSTFSMLFAKRVSAFFNTSFFFHKGSIKVPSSTVIAWSGTISSIPANWELCDGTGGTPDLSGKFIIGSGGGYNKNDVGGGGVSGTTTSNGSHTGGSGLIGNGSGSSSSLYGKDIEGAHSHTLGGTLESPPHYTLAYIRSTAETPIPANGVVWSKTSSLGALFSTFTQLNEKFVLGVADDTRASGGADLRNYTISTLTAGSHRHGTGNFCCVGGTQNHGAALSGGHVHTDIAGTHLFSKPPYCALSPMLCTSDSMAPNNIIVAYDGDLANLPDGWKLCDGSGGTVNLAGRFPIGAGGSISLTSTGGAIESTPLTGPVASHSSSHTHKNLTWGTPYQASARHHNYTWAHDHTYNATLDSTPPYHCLHYIMRT